MQTPAVNFDVIDFMLALCAWFGGWLTLLVAGGFALQLVRSALSDMREIK